MTTTTRTDALAALTAAQAKYDAAFARADAAFARYFAKLQAGERTNGGRYSWLMNLANYASAERAVAIGKVWDAFGDDDDADRAITAICGSDYN